MTVTDISRKSDTPMVIRLGAYCRVSSNSADQLHSFAAQIRYYKDYVRKNPQYKLVDVYADATCIIGTNQSPNGWAAICPYFSCFQSIWRRHTR